MLARLLRNLSGGRLPRLTGVKAVTFDVDGTLWDFQTVMRHSLGKVLEELGRLDPEAAAMFNVEKLVEVRDRVHDELRGVVVNLNELRVEGFRRALSEAGRPNELLATHLCGLYFEHRDAGRSPFRDVFPTLQALHPRYTLGVLSNGNTYPPDLGLDGLFEFTVVSQDHGGIEKPDPRIFEIALEKAGCSPEELIHVGDSLENDIVGAKKAGVKSVWLNRNGHESPDIRVDSEMPSLRQLADVL